MDRGAVIALVLMLVVAAPVAEDVEQPSGRFGVAFDSRWGYATVPYPLATHARARGYAASFVARAHVELVRDVHLEARVPFAEAWVQAPGRAAFPTTVVGNPDLRVSYRRAATSRLEWSVRFAFAAPLGHGHARPEVELWRNQAQAIASALDGWREPALRSPGRLGLTPAGGVRFRPGRFELAAELELALMPRVLDVGASPSRVNAVAIAPIASGRVRYSIWGPMSVAVRSFLVVYAAWPARELREAMRAQHVLEPEVAFRFARDHVLTSVRFRVPTGGPLTGSYALGVHLGLAF